MHEVASCADAIILQRSWSGEERFELFGHPLRIMQLIFSHAFFLAVRDSPKPFII